MLFLTSCSSTRVLISTIKNEQYLQDQKFSLRGDDFKAHLSHLGRDFIGSKGIEVVGLSRRDRRYLEGMVDRLLENNRIIYGDKPRLSFYVIKSRIPFYFSLPGGYYFYSTGIFKKYIQSGGEGLLSAIVAIQTFRIMKNVYERKSVVPTGTIGLDRMLSLTRISLEDRNEVNKWGYLTLKRADFDPTSILNWIQLRNKNILDFTLMDGEVSVVSREEFAFKNFLATLSDPSDMTRVGVSSPGFYRLVRNIGRRSL